MSSEYLCTVFCNELLATIILCKVFHISMAAILNALLDRPHKIEAGP